MNEIERILLEYIPDLRENGEELIGCCPFHQDNSPSFGLNTRSGLWHCFGCGEGGNLVSLLERLTGNFLKSSVLASKIDFEAPKEVLAETQLPDCTGDSNYLSGRGYAQEVLDRFDIYYNIHRGLIIPVENERSELVGWIEKRNGYRYSRGLPKRRILYNLNRNLSERKIYVVEGALDCIWLEQCGYKAVATLGSCVSIEQIQLLNKWFVEIVAVPDNDEAGHIMGARLSKLARANIIIPPIKGTDIQDYKEDEIKELLGG